ncbi:DASH complex subunit DAD3 [Rhodotorula toruloides]|nr:DASH complex subunit DAD3 [Rhodotorula toruloides]
MEHASAHELVERLQQQVLDEYKLTARNLDDVSRLALPLAQLAQQRDRWLTLLALVQVAAIVQRLSSAQPHLLSELRPLEQKLGLILTLFKASVWSLLRQREDQQLQEDDLRQ